MSDAVTVGALADALDAHLRKDEIEPALSVCAELESADVEEPRWPHRRGDLLLRTRRREDAIDAYERAVDLYARQGFVARAAAMAKVILGLDASRMDVLERVDGEAALELRKRRDASGAFSRPVDPAHSAARGADVSALVSLVRDAKFLAKAEDAREDEVRFAEADSSELELDLSEFDLPPPSRPRTAFALAKMPAVPLLAGAGKNALADLVATAELRTLTDGEDLVRAGEPSDALFILVEGEAEVRIPGLPPGSVVLGEGEIVGETSLLPGVTRKADVVARGALRALRLPRDALLALVARHPTIEAVLYELLTKRLLGNLMRTHELFTAFEPATRVELARLFELRRASAGTHLLERGKRSDGIYVPLLGTVTATLADGRVVDVPAGCLLGEQSLLSRAPSTCSVETRTDALVLRLSVTRFTELAAMFPPVLAHLTDVATSGSLDDFVSRGSSAV